MSKIGIDTVEKAIIREVQEIADQMGVAVNANSACAPGSVGLSSHVLVTVMSRIENILDITIPDNCYIFHDKTSLRQLTIREASEKLLRVINKGKNVR